MKMYRFALPLLGLLALTFAPVPNLQAQVAQDPYAYASEMSEEEIEELNKLQAVMGAGYENFKAHKESGNLTETDKKIQTLLEQTFPALDARMQKQAQELDEEYNRIFEEAMRKAGEFTMEKMQKAQEEASVQIQTKYTQLQEQNMKDTLAVADQLADALVANQTQYPNYKITNREAAQNLALQVYALYSIESISPEQQKQMLREALLGLGLSEEEAEQAIQELENMTPEELEQVMQEMFQGM